MLHNYFKVALRNILKHKFFSIINVLGLTVGVSACLFIILYVTDELSYDKFHTEAENIYRIGLHGKISGQEINTASSCPPLSNAMVSEIPGVEEAIRVDKLSKVVVKNGDKAFTDDRLIYSDSNFFRFFSFKLVEGDPAKVLNEPNSIVLTETLAKKYFEGPAVGQLLTLFNDNISFKVTGIAQDPPHNSHFTFSGILSTSSDRERFNSPIWLNNGLYTYFRKTKATSVESINAKLEDMVAKYVGPQVEQFLGISMEKFREQGNVYSYVGYPMLDTHLYSTWGDEIEPTSSISYVYVFSAVGAFILIIACINFMNLTTARSAGRAKEVGLRKTLGSFRSQMIGQFLAESTVYALLAVAIAVVVTYMLLPQFNLLAAKQLTLNALLSPGFLMGTLVLVFIVGLLAGSYPAFYLTSFSAVQVLKGKARAGMKSKGIRSTLVVFQFALSILLIICTSVGYQQIHYMQNRHMGMDKHNVLVLNNMSRLKSNRGAFKNSVLSLPGVEKASYTNNTFPGVNNTTAFRSSGTNQDYIMGVYFADVDHLEVMKFNLVQGRFFSDEFASDTLAAVINEAAVKELGWEKPLEEELITFEGDPDDVRQQKLRIVGVVKDFNFESFKAKVRPMVIRLTKESRNLLIRYNGSAEAMISQVDQIWKQQAHGDPFEYSFLDQNFDQLFREEQRLSKLFLIFTGLTIFIACLGLFALAAFTAEQRTKEIGIRKAMGASVIGITTLLSKEFTILVIISIGLAVVPAWYVLNYWLSQFVYRIDISPFVFLISGLVALLIAWLTVAFQSLKAALIKPVESLRYE